MTDGLVGRDRDLTVYAVAAGIRVLRATGAQFEADLSFAGLHQVLFPLLDSNLHQLEGPQRTVLRIALGLGPPGEAPDWMTLSHAALDLLTRAAPVLVVVDDVPWLDKASGRVLAFIARRAAGARLGFLATMRTGDEGLFDRSGSDHVSRDWSAERNGFMPGFSAYRGCPVGAVPVPFKAAKHRFGVPSGFGEGIRLRIKRRKLLGAADPQQGHR